MSLRSATDSPAGCSPAAGLVLSVAVRGCCVAGRRTARRSRAITTDTKHSTRTTRTRNRTQPSPSTHPHRTPHPLRHPLAAVPVPVRHTHRLHHGRHWLFTPHHTALHPPPSASISLVLPWIRPCSQPPPSFSSTQRLCSAFSASLKLAPLPSCPPSNHQPVLTPSPSAGLAPLSSPLPSLLLVLLLPLAPFSSAQLSLTHRPAHRCGTAAAAALLVLQR